MNIRPVFVLTSFTSVISLLLLATGYYVLAQNPESSDILNQTGSFNANSTIDIVSEVENVTVTKFNILGPETIGVSLKHATTGDASAVKVLADAVNTNYNLIQETLKAISAINASTIDTNLSNTTLINDKLNQLTSVLSMSNGTVTVAAGWKSPTDVVIKLEGTATLDDANIIGIVVRK